MIFLIILVSIMVLAGAGFGGRRLKRELDTKKVYGIGYKERVPLSYPAEWVLKAYNELPKANRPFGNIHNIVKALDVKYGVDSVNSHFSGYRGNTHSWDMCECSYYGNRGCNYGEYKDMYDEIVNIKLALAEHEHALAVAGVENGLQMTEQFMEALRQERQIITETTKELT